MPKHVYLYEDLEKGSVEIVNSMTQISSLTGMSYRTIQRIFKSKDKYYNEDGKYRVVRVVYSMDRRKNNSNPSINY